MSMVKKQTIYDFISLLAFIEKELDSWEKALRKYPWVTCSIQ